MRRPFDPTAWPRRAAFEFFRGFDKPWFNVCARVDVTALRPALAVAGTGSLTLALHHAALALANAVEPFRLRLQGGQLWLYDVVHAGTTVLRPDGSFGFAYLDHHPQFPAFAAAAAPALAAARDAPDSFAPRSDALFRLAPRKEAPESSAPRNDAPFRLAPSKEAPRRSIESKRTPSRFWWRRSAQGPRTPALRPTSPASLRHSLEAASKR